MTDEKANAAPPAHPKLDTEKGRTNRAMSPEDRAEWVLWSVRNDPEIDAPSGQEEIARRHIIAGLRKARSDALNEAAERFRRESITENGYGSLGDYAEWVAEELRALSSEPTMERGGAPQAVDPA